MAWFYSGVDKFRQHRHGCIVDMEAIGGQDVTADCLVNGIKGCHTTADPASHSGDIDFDAFARIGLALPVQWLVEQEF
jgi:hypothetical protein